MSSCVQMRDGSGWMGALRRRAAQERLPLSAMLELTGRCNLRCHHCYVGEQEGAHDRQRRELETREVVRSIDEWVDAGCLYLVLTGGDPMMRPDFCEIYRHACERGMVVTVFCNGTLVTERVIDLFREFPPRKVEVSLYGATDMTHDRITRVAGSRVRAWEGIDHLRGAGIRVSLKAMLMTLNRHEMEAMAGQAREAGCPFRFDAAIFPCLETGGTEPLEYRVSPEEAVRLDMAVPEQRERWTRSVLAKRGEIDSDRLYPCGAGTTSFCVDPTGAYSPCLLTRHYRYPGAGRSFGEIWGSDLGEIGTLKRRCGESSFSGELRGACSHCPGFNRLETGDEETESGPMKKMARLRYDAVMAIRQDVKEE